MTRRASVIALVVVVGLAVGLAGGACDDGLDQRLAIVREPRVLAVIATPAEAKPGAQVTYDAVLAGPDGPLDSVPRWAYCLAPKPPTEDNAVSDGCLSGDQLQDLGTAPTVTAVLPADGCLRFGPDTPPGGFRPRDADPTGGYYQPIRLDAPSDPESLLAFGLSRITCKLPTAPPEIARDYELRYVANANPTLDPIAIDHVPADTDFMLTAAWPAEAAESYLYFDTLSQTLIDRREAMRVSWFATAGTLEADASAVGEDERVTSVSTVWHTPTAGSVVLWFVLRDSRGGIATRTIEVAVE